MELWSEVYRCIMLLRPACSRVATFVWMMLALVGMCARPDLAGVTSFVRTGWLKERCYLRLLHMFHSSAIELDRLTELWTKLVLMLLTPLTVDGFRVCVGDGIKIPKEGKKMPAVKCLHNESENNSKAEYIMGHSFQVVSIPVTGIKNTVFAVPLISRISEGVVFSNRDKRTLLDEFVIMFTFLWPQLTGPLLLIVDAYYASKKIIKPLLEAGHHLVTRVRCNTVAFHPAPKPAKPKKRKKSDRSRLALTLALWPASILLAMMNNPKPELVGLRGLHRHLRRYGISLQWLKTEAEAGRIPCMRAGRRFLFSVEAVEQALLRRAASNSGSVCGGSNAP